MSVVLKQEEKQNIHIPYMANIRRIAQEVIKKKNLSEEEIMKSLDFRRYEK